MNRLLILVMITSHLLWAAVAAGGETSPDRKALWRKHIQSTFEGLRQQHGQLFEELAEAVSNTVLLDEFFSRERHPDKVRLYHQFLVEVIQHAMKGDVGDAMFMHLVLRATPPEDVLVAIAPAIGPGQALEGLMKRSEDAVLRYLQGQHQQGYPGEPDFSHFEKFLKGGQDRGIADRPNVDLLIQHMFRTSPSKAMEAMLRVEYGLRPDGNAYQFVKDDIDKVKHLQLAEHEISDYLYRRTYSFPTTKAQQEHVQSLLHDLSHHAQWWVRLYVAEILRRHAELRDTALTARLVKDAHPAVREAIAESPAGHKPRPVEEEPAELKERQR